MLGGDHDIPNRSGRVGQEADRLPERHPAERVDLCSIDPGFDVDLYVSVDLRTMTAIWMGLETVRAAIASRRMLLTGNRQLATAMQTWLGLSPFAKERKLAS